VVRSRNWKENMIRPRLVPQGASLADRQGRRLDYLRLAVTDRCNLRCRYCMPAKGIDLVSHADLLSFEEAERLIGLFADLGLRKLRVTGGEPLVRSGTLGFMAAVGRAYPSLELLLTTNGLLLERHLPAIVAAGVKRVNVSLDSLDPATWSRLTRRDGHAAVLASIRAVQEAGLGLKINVVVMGGINDHEVPGFAALTRDSDLEVRFIEAMAFDGGGGVPTAHLRATDIHARLAAYSDLTLLPGRPTEVARRFRLAGHTGTVGIIAGHTRTFCGTCNRLRLDAQGRLRTCLYGAAGLDLRALLRAGADDADLAAAVQAELAHRHTDGHAAERATNGKCSMASIGG